MQTKIFYAVQVGKAALFSVPDCFYQYFSHNVRKNRKERAGNGYSRSRSGNYTAENSVANETAHLKHPNTTRGNPRNKITKTLLNVIQDKKNGKLCHMDPYTPALCKLFFDQQHPVRFLLWKVSFYTVTNCYSQALNGAVAIKRQIFSKSSRLTDL